MVFFNGLMILMGVSIAVGQILPKALPCGRKRLTLKGQGRKMNWKDLKISTKILSGFGTMIALLALVSVVSILGFEDISLNNNTLIRETNASMFVVEKEVDHYKWAQNVTDLFLDDTRSKITAQTDPTKCGFGKWLFSEETKKIAEKDPEIASLLGKVKDPHQRLHDSAIKINAVYEPFDMKLRHLLDARLIDHLKWIKQLSISLLTGHDFEGGVNPKTCAFGKWYYSYKPESDAFAAFLKRMEDPHIRLHHSAKTIVSRISDGDMDGAQNVFQQETIPSLSELENLFGEIDNWIGLKVQKQDAAMTIYTMETNSALDETKDLLGRIQGVFSERADTASMNMALKMTQTKRSVVIFAVAAAIIGVLFALFISSRISKKVIASSKFAEVISEGDMTQTLDIDQKDEVGVLAAALNDMTGHLKAMIQDISEGTQTLTASATELSVVSEQINTNSDQTAKKSRTVSAAAEEMSANMTSVAAATEQTTANLQMIVSAAEEMTATINEITKNVSQGSTTTSKAVEKAREVSEKVGELGRAADDISKVTQTISDISEQTNLLALNATIEAARAGEVGKGFAVVAAEIKALAQQTSEANNEISDKIIGVQTTTSDAVAAIQSILSIIKEINDMVTTVAAAVEEQSATTREITVNVSQAAAGVQEINENINHTTAVAENVTQSIDEVSEAAEETSAGSEQVNTSARELSKLAETLGEMIRRFKV